MGRGGGQAQGGGGVMSEGGKLGGNFFKRPRGGEIGRGMRGAGEEKTNEQEIWVFLYMQPWTEYT